jgi:predicted RNase H-like HicB family nuclease
MMVWKGATSAPSRIEKESRPMTEMLFMVEEDPEGGFVATAIGESIVTQGETMDELRANIRDAIVCHFDEGARPRAVRLHFVRDEVMSL